MSALLSPPRAEAGAASPRIDAHTHVFQRSLAMAPLRRYTPGYDATLQRLFAHLEVHELDAAVLVQPSFLGTDNGYLLAAIAAAPRRLRGVAMIAADATERGLDELARQGIVGVRFNLVGAAMPDLASDAWVTLLRRIAARGWHVELHRQARDLPPLIDAALAQGLRVVVDHYGRPEPSLGLADPALDALMAYGPDRSVWVKLSAAYRCAPHPQAFSITAVQRFVEVFGADRLLWGSDWPHTQFESQADVAQSLQALSAAPIDETARKAIIGGTASALYGLDIAMTSPNRTSTSGAVP